MKGEDKNNRQSKQNKQTKNKNKNRKQKQNRLETVADTGRRTLPAGMTNFKTITSLCICINYMPMLL